MKEELDELRRALEEIRREVAFLVQVQARIAELLHRLLDRGPK